MHIEHINAQYTFHALNVYESQMYLYLIMDVCISRHLGRPPSPKLCTFSM